MDQNFPPSWDTLLDTIRDRLNLPEATHSISNWRQFIGVIRAQAVEKREKHVEADLNALSIMLFPIRDFSEIIGGQPQNASSTDIDSILWEILLAIITESFSKGLLMRTILDWIEDLASLLPSEIPNKSDQIHLRSNSMLHAPLQSIYSTYVYGLEELWRNVTAVQTKMRNPPRPESWTKYLVKCKEQFEDGKSNYRQRLSAMRASQQLGASGYSFFISLDPRPEDLLGSGSFGDVYRYHDARRQEYYAVKRILTRPGSTLMSNPNQVKQEIRIMGDLTHHHITKIDFWDSTDSHFDLYMRPLAQGNLDIFLKDTEKIKWVGQKSFHQWFGCLIAAVSYAHQNKTIHNDIKPSNILIHESGKRILLTDFGLAKNFTSAGDSASYGQTHDGTRKYLAPECRLDGKRGRAVDIFALGCVFAEMLSFLAGQTLSQFDQQRRDMCNSRDFRDFLGRDHLGRWAWEIKEHFDAIKRDLSNVVVDMLSEKLEHRPKARELFPRFSEEAGLRCERCCP